MPGAIPGFSIPSSMGGSLLMENFLIEMQNELAEKLNGRLAMLGVMAAIGAYALTGQIIPGVF